MSTKNAQHRANSELELNDWRRLIRAGHGRGSMQFRRRRRLYKIGLGGRAER